MGKERVAATQAVCANTALSICYIESSVLDQYSSLCVEYLSSKVSPLGTGSQGHI